MCSREAWDAQSCSKVASSEKCSSLSSAFTSDEHLSLSKNSTMVRAPLARVVDPSRFSDQLGVELIEAGLDGWQLARCRSQR